MYALLISDLSTILLLVENIIFNKPIFLNTTKIAFVGFVLKSVISVNFLSKIGFQQSNII